MVKRHTAYEGAYKADEQVVYQIKVQGSLDDRWSDWFSGLVVAVEGADEGPPITTLTGSIDQAALRGIVNKIWDLNLTLISVVPIEANGSLSATVIPSDRKSLS